MRLTFALIVIGLSAWAVGPAAGMQSPASSPGSLDACVFHRALGGLLDDRQRLIDMLVSYRAKGWALTEAGRAVLGGAPLPGEPHAGAPFNQVTGQVILAKRSESTEPRSLASRRPQAVERAQLYRTAYLFCDFGQQGNVNYTTGYGWAHVEWFRDSITGQVDSPSGPNVFCNSAECLHYAWHNPNSNWQIDFAEAHWANGWPTIEGSYCSGY